ncbi:unnamed protein product [Cyclocybe aegerita]|uniref:Uncharacterized protein n=1 Tax=Cyclocybe aegerita TaxID=1973307 RepID=A0A8S0WV08_CYCAE|nr:unnamed protein product [Cyclocybe aegerita]
MPETEKFRLYITLQHRNELPGYHWALLLAPKYETNDPQDPPDSWLFHATNSIQVPQGGMSALQAAYGPAPWRKETRAVSSIKSGNMIGRVLIAKLSSSTPLLVHTQYIDEVVSAVPIVQNNPRWTCAVWALQALQLLRDHGGFFSTIPDPSGEGFYRAIYDFGDTALNAIQNRTKPIKRATDFPCVDMRVR